MEERRQDSIVPSTNQMKVQEAVMHCQPDATSEWRKRRRGRALKRAGHHLSRSINRGDGDDTNIKRKKDRSDQVSGRGSEFGYIEVE